MQLLHDNVLVEPFVNDDVTTGGLFIPESYREPSNKVRVRAIGTKVKNFKEGETAFRVKGHGEPFIVEGTTMYMTKEDALIAKL
jgi:co-chaperonin GroES (HSP10)